MQRVGRCRCAVPVSCLMNRFPVGGMCPSGFHWHRVPCLSRTAIGADDVGRVAAQGRRPAGTSDVVQGLSLALKLGVTVDDIALSHHTYPSYGEGVKAAAEKALAPAVAR